MLTRILDLDGGIAAQSRLVRRSGAVPLPFQGWGPHLRLACRFGAFRRFERDLADLAGGARDTEQHLTFIGSGDFHHVSLALLRRLSEPCNLLVIDNHPDWMRGIPFLHCGTWLYHAARLPQVARIFHVGGEVDFDNAYRWLAPWPDLRSGKITVLPALRPFRAGSWPDVPHRPLRERPDERANREQIEDLLGPYRDDLMARPLYVSLDKDVLTTDEALVNWDSGHLLTSEALDVLEAFVSASAELLGMDVVGDWSPVSAAGLLRQGLIWAEHPTLKVCPEEARERNEALNLALLDEVASLLGARANARPAWVVPIQGVPRKARPTDKRAA